MCDCTFSNNCVQPPNQISILNRKSNHVEFTMDEAEAAAAKAEYIRRKYLATAPGDASTKEYIANRYLSGNNDGKKKKKKKVSKRIQKGNIGIVDEEEDSWRNSKVEEEDTMMPIEEPTMTETKSLYTPKASSWTTIREGERDQGMDVDDEEEEDERPMIVGSGTYKNRFSHEPEMCLCVCVRAGYCGQGSEVDLLLSFVPHV